MVNFSETENRKWFLRPLRCGKGEIFGPNMPVENWFSRPYILWSIIWENRSVNKTTTMQFVSLYAALKIS